ncbi:MAG: transglutaminase-like domain-containing protein [Pseudomonadota bacterium]
MQAGTRADQFRALIKAPEEDISLAEAALVFAGTVYDDIDVSRYLGRIDDLVATVNYISAPDSPLLERVNTLNDVLFEHEGYRGNSQDYSDPRNSFLNEVIDRKLGIPISLSALYLELGWRLDMELIGVSFPGHFLVKLQMEAGAIVLDPFHRGAVLDRHSLLRRMSGFVKDQRQAEALFGHVLKGATKKEILARMLRNLKQIYAQDGVLENALIAADLICAALPGEAICLKERGELYEALEVPALAAQDFAAYLQLSPDAADASAIRERIVKLGAQRSPLN